ncbi:P-loop containing nucleoside triphosphate hydrolase protein [Sistotremastrum niveocremeum HHB9708]|uniref:Ribosome assembly protein 1 n=1 Tax=Sistotremastrum niveocremeum HHB9708 TaxID=1314777 RepID=A0A164N1B4_9AGAM|nr:P-loop containing nucleoside triphosphate hydrolase protein [Sistotremastrum niveocremeum HHB9708]
MSSTAENIRVITVLGHVDHGKTTFVDSLLAANNIISSRMAGKIRYMDSREDEQERGITMESSAVSLNFKVMSKDSDGEPRSRDYVVNLIDTPGHVDFSSEVSTASRLCDGALVMVDVVEGVCTQTVSVLRQAWFDRLRPILIINKMDRLITELKLSPEEAYHHLTKLIEQVNVVMGDLFSGERMESDWRWREKLESQAESNASKGDQGLQSEEMIEEYEEQDDEDLYFAPEKGNVIFCSAIDGWGFRLGKFAQLYASKLGVKEANLRRVLWGDYYLDPKTKRVIGHKHLRGRHLKPLFVQFVLDNIWAVYDSVLLNSNPTKTSKIVDTLKLQIPPRDLKAKDARILLCSIFSQWLPLSTAAIQAVIDVIPSPLLAQQTRMPTMLKDSQYNDNTLLSTELKADLLACNSDSTAHVVAFVSKMFAVARKNMPDHKQGSETDGSEATEVILGFARLYSGILKVNTTVLAVLPKCNATLPAQHPRNAPFVRAINISALYTMMGRDLVPVSEVRAGNVFAVAGLEGTVFRSATLCSPNSEGTGPAPDSQVSEALEKCVVNLGGVTFQAPPIVRVALEPEHSVDMPKLIEGLKILSQSDPCVQTFQQQTGEHVILTAGELHFERCLKDLRERFARIEIQASDPIVPFRETAIKVPDVHPSASQGVIQGHSAQLAVNFSVRVVPLPEVITTFLKTNVSTIRALKHCQKDVSALVSKSTQDVTDVENDFDFEMNLAQSDASTSRLDDDQFWKQLEDICQSEGEPWLQLSRTAWAFGPARRGPNVLIDARVGTNTRQMRDPTTSTKTEEGLGERDSIVDLEDSLEAGFQIATFQGPLCGEPMEGMAFFVEKIDIDAEKLHNENVRTRMAQETGSLISSNRDACRSGLLEWSPRLLLAMYSCEIQASSDVLGKVYGVVARRRGRIIAEDLREGTNLFSIRAMLPVTESFGFADEIRKKTSGAASPQLVFNGYELLDEDPFWVPTTEEELEDLGTKADRANMAKYYMDNVRERKGMFVDKKLVEFAEKQRTLKR